MNLEKKYLYYAKVIEVCHILWTLLYLASVVLLFAWAKYRIYSALILAVTGGVNVVMGFCPLTKAEAYCLEKTGRKFGERYFIPRLFKKYLGVRIPDRAADVLLKVFLAISLVVLAQEMIRYIYVFL